MNRVTAHKKFIFNSKIDQRWLYSLYEDDYTYIAEVFNNSLDTLKEELPSFSGAFESNDISALKRATHKLKPLFGFAGLLHHQEQMGRFENACSNVSNVENLTMQYIEVIEIVNEGKNIIQEECKRLSDFIA